MSHVLDLLHHLCQLSDLLLIVSGPPGAGKSTVIEELLRRGGEQWRHCLIKGSPKIGPQDSLSRLLAGFQLPQRQPSSEAGLRVLETHLRALNASNVVVVIAVDDTDLLPRATREYLLGLVDRWEGLQINLVLSCAVPAERVAGVHGAAGRAHLVELQPLSESETGEYLAARMRRAGLNSDLADADVQLIYAESRGLPGAVHRHARAVLLEAESPLTTRSAPVEVCPRPAIAGLGLILAATALAAALAWFVARETAREDAGPPVRVERRPGASASAQSTVGELSADTVNGSAQTGAPEGEKNTPAGAEPLGN